MKHKHRLFSSYILISLSFVRYDWMFRQKVVVHFIYYLKSWSDILHSMLLILGSHFKVKLPMLFKPDPMSLKTFLLFTCHKVSITIHLKFSTACSRLENKENKISIKFPSHKVNFLGKRPCWQREVPCTPGSPPPLEPSLCKSQPLPSSWIKR